MFHGGGTRAARAAGQRRVDEARIHGELAAWERQRSAHEKALAPWANEPALRAPGFANVDSRDLRRIAREMSAIAKTLRAAARLIDEEWED